MLGKLSFLLEEKILFVEMAKLLFLCLQRPPSFAQQTGGKIIAELKNQLLGFIFPSILGSLAQAGLNRAAQAITMGQVKKQFAQDMPSCIFEGNQVSLDLLQWPVTQSTLQTQLPETPYIGSVRLGDVLRISQIVIDQEGLKFRVELSEELDELKKLWGFLFSKEEGKES